MSIVRYCPKCGRVSTGANRCCKFCNNETFDTRYTTDDYIKTIGFEQKILDEYAKNSPEFDEELCNQRIAKEYAASHGSMSSEQKAVLKDMGVIPELNTNKVECPYCHSTYVSKIGTLSRVASIGILGLASKKIGKQWHCNSCKSDF